jgi:hypothetical protein
MLLDDPISSPVDTMPNNKKLKKKNKNKNKNGPSK